MPLLIPLLDITIPSNCAFELEESLHLISLMLGKIWEFNCIYMCYGPLDWDYKENGIWILCEVTCNLVSHGLLTFFETNPLCTTQQSLIKMDHSQAISVAMTLWKSEQEFLSCMYPDTTDILQYQSPHTVTMFKIAQDTLEGKRHQCATWMRAKWVCALFFSSCFLSN